MTKKSFAALFLALLMMILPFTALAGELDPDGNTDNPVIDERTDYYENEGLILTYTLNDDGTVSVNERWSVYCKGVPGVFTAKLYTHGGISVTDLRVTDDEGKGYVRIFGDRDESMQTDVFTHSESADKTVTTIDIFHITTDDHFNINISYTLSGAVTNFADAGVFEHTVIDDRLLGEVMPEIQVNLITHRDLEKFSDFKLSIFSNLEHELKPVNKAETDFYLYEVPVGEAVTVKAVLPLDLFTNNTLTSDEYILGTQDYTKPDFSYIAPPLWEIFTPSVIFKIDLATTARNFPGGWAGIIMMLISPLFLLGGIDRFGKHTSLRKKTNRPFVSDIRRRYEKTYPDNLAYAQAARLANLAKGDYAEKPRYFASIILSLYAKGYVNILATKRNFKITLAKREDEHILPDYESLMLIFIEEAMGKNPSITMAELAEYMFLNCEKVYALHSSVLHLLDEELLKEEYMGYMSDNLIYNLFTSKIKAVNLNIYFVVMVIFAGICNFMYIMGSSRGYLALGLISLFAVTVMALSKTPKKVITQKGEDHAHMWDGFARTLNEAERIITADNLSEMENGRMLFIYATAFGANKRALRHLNGLLPWVGEDTLHEDAGSLDEMYGINISRLLQFLDDIEKMASNCLKLYGSEKGPLYKYRSRRRIKDFEELSRSADDEEDIINITEEIVEESDARAENQ